MKEVTYSTPHGERKLEVFDEVIAYDVSDQPRDGMSYAHTFGENALKKDMPYQADAYDKLCTKAMERGGWYLGTASAEAQAAHLHQKLPGGCQTAGTLCRENDQLLKIALPRMDVKVDPDLTADQAKAALARFGYQVLHQYAFAANLFLVAIPAGKDVFECTRLCDKDGLFEFGEPEFIEFLQERSLIRDEFFNVQWHLDKIEANTAWAQGILGQDTHLALIDSGFDLKHPDLAKAVTPLTGFFDRVGRLDIDHTHFPTEHQQHGTFCAGMACARINDIAVVGVAPEAAMTCLVPTMQNLGSQSTLAKAISYAANPTQEVAVGTGFREQDGADVISCSLGPSTSSDWIMRSVLRHAIDDAWENGRGGRGTPVFWAVANADQKIKGLFTSDQVIAHRNTIAVGSSNKSDLADPESAFGPELDFLAPGVQVVSASNRTPERAEVHSGASYAAPCAAATAVLMLTANPNLSSTQVREIMRSTCDKVGPDAYHQVAGGTRNDRYGFGRINVAKAVAEAKRRMSS